MAKYRAGRINEEVKKAISSIIQNDIRDPRLTSMISVIKVDVTKDLRYAKVYVSILGDDAKKKETMDILKKSESFIRKELGYAVKLRYTPEVIIELDTSIEKGMHIDALLEKIKGSDKDDNR
ncbi:30S ribosome-binding factor RbfA [Clostridium felsineum]|uniref:Ribosome-binding factor A n=1 Tax=Clostridium felsineum TaxID=36839 RepID=A0A1S8L4Q8_9CLOT|nr:30S ribosome-binding factor RbfA [Clostridium felsineum]MCR3758549.1 30S ribosome-binding factor RbfA [Clostridium felsineum]URZ00712.1 Ribosome-binding factor A [Clostridium felsineum]URZ06649.1 Ribosome-binding factor A [Clostridium felsineum]URZ11682.1 Ribosome-binding factor A [Clostridium felsineum]URZ16240.1 Ribosome-binding factor A [Clostridium felsineum DSM 794]